MSRDGDGSWTEAQAHLLAQPMSAALRAWIVSDTATRPVYGGPEHGPKTRPKVPEPWKDMPGGALAWLATEFGHER